MSLNSGNNGLGGGLGLLSGSAQLRLNPDGNNWPTWKMRIRGVLASVWDAVESLQNAGGAAAAAAADGSSGSGSGDAKAKAKAKAEADPAAAAELARHSSRAYGVFMQTLSDTQLHMVMPPMVSVNDAAGVWSVLVRHYERKTTASKAHTRSMLHKTKMRGDEEFDVYKARIMQLAAALKNMGEQVSDGELIYVLLEGLPADYSGVRQALEVQNDLTVDQLSDHLRDHQEKKRYEGEKEREEEVIAMVRRSRGGAGGGGGARGGRGRGDGGGDANSSSGDRDESTHQCRLCGKKGHMEWHCEKRRGGGWACFRCGREGHQMRDCRGKIDEDVDEHAGLIMDDDDYFGIPN